MSPTLHNAAFKELGLPYRYSIYESEGVDERIHKLITEPTFGGASVIYPHKLEIGRFLQGASVCAEQIGAINTIIVKEDKAGHRTLIGDNTDWLGIQACIAKSRISVSMTDSVIILGAGGAARAAVYAAQQLGKSNIILINRTLSRARAIAKDFPTSTFSVFQSIEEACRSNNGCLNSNIIIGCIPADHLRTEDISDRLFSQASPGVLVEMAYRPRTTPLMKVADRHVGWKVFNGADMLKEQAYAQFSLWTDSPAPKWVMADAVAEAWKKKESGVLEEVPNED